MSFSLDKFSMHMGCKHPSTTLRVTVRLSEVEVCFRKLNDIELEMDFSEKTKALKIEVF
jgi:hypothetical protein